MLDRDIRPLLVEHLAQTELNCALFHELPLDRGSGRADVVAVNGHISGFEIKSERDSLARLPDQIGFYDLVCEQSTLVVAPKHLAGARQLLPKHWGIWVVQSDKAQAFKQVRKAKANFQLDRSALIRLLWKNECVSVLRRCGGEDNRMSSTLPVIRYWEALDQIPTKRLVPEIRDVLKLRAKKQAGRQRNTGDD